MTHNCETCDKTYCKTRFNDAYKYACEYHSYDPKYRKRTFKEIIHDRYTWYIAIILLTFALTSFFSFETIDNAETWWGASCIVAGCVSVFLASIFKLHYEMSILLLIGFARFTFLVFYTT